MAESNSKLPAPLQKFATDLKDVLIRTETAIREMRAREASTKERKLEKHELCPLCGGPDVNGRCKCIESLQKNAQLGYGSGPSMGASGGGGTQPMGMAEKPMKKCGPGCGGGKHMDKCDLSEVKAGKDLTKSGTTPHMDEMKPGKDLAKHSSSAAALAPAAPKPMTSVAQANKELGGFKSLASSPTGPGAGPKKFNVIGAGRSGNPAVHAVSGTIPAAKSEKNPGSARSPYGTGAAGHASQTNMPSSLKANMAVTKGELPVVKPAPEKSVEGSKAPKAGKDATAKKQGSGGEIKKGAKLAKAAPALAAKAPAGKGVPGKQPVGQGGGDAHKTASTAKLPPPGGSKGTSAVTKPVPGKLFAAGAAEVGRMKSAASAPLPSVDVDVSEFDKGPAKFAPAAASTMPKGNPAALQGVRDNMNNAADLKQTKGGVGFLRGLMSMFAPKPKANTAVDQAVGKLRAMNPGFAERGPTISDSQGNVQTLPAGTKSGPVKSQRFHGATPLQRGEMDMKKAAMSLTKKDLEDDELDKGLSINHSRTMLSVSPRRRAKKTR